LDAVNIRKGVSTMEQAKTIVQTESTPKVTRSNWVPQIVRAIDSNLIIQIDYQKFCQTAHSTRQVEPYLLKEDRHRWYVIGRTVSNGKITTYALDRINELIVLEKRFTPIIFDFKEYFKYSFGITVPEADPIEVVLSFNQLEGFYVKTLPIHPSQKILIDTDTEFQISVTVKPSWEFYEKILGYGGTVRVFSPQSVIENLKSIAVKILKRY